MMNRKLHPSSDLPIGYFVSYAFSSHPGLGNFPNWDNSAFHIGMSVFTWLYINPTGHPGL